MKNKKIILGLVGIFLLSFFSSMMNPSISYNNSLEISQGEINPDELIKVDFPIYIDSNWSEYVNLYDWCSGNGTEEDPYIIEGIYVTNEEQTARISIKTAEFFIIRNSIFYNYSDPCSHYTDAALYIEKGEYGVIDNCTFINCSRGISIYETKESFDIINCKFRGSHNDTKTGMGSAIKIGEAKGVNISFNDIDNYYDGIIIRDSEEVYIHNNSIKTNFGYISDTGVYLYTVGNSEIINNDFYGCNMTGHDFDVITSGNEGLEMSLIENCYNLTIYGNRFYDLDGNLIVPDIISKSINMLFILIPTMVIIICVLIVLKIKIKKVYKEGVLNKE